MRKAFTWSLRATSYSPLAYFDCCVGLNVRDQVVPVLALLQTTEGHLGAGNVLLGVLEVFELQSWLEGNEKLTWECSPRIVHPM